MKRSLVAALFLAVTLSACVEQAADDAAPAVSVSEALSAPITLRYQSDDTDELTATAQVAASPRSIALRVRMPITEIPPEVVAKLRSEEGAQVSIVDGLQGWAIRDGVNGVASVNLEGLAGFHARSFHPTICGNEIAKARVILSDGTTTFPARVSVLEPLALFGLYADADCLEKEEWGWSWWPPFRWQLKEWCEARNGGTGCSAVVDCGTALGGTRRCTGSCYQVDGVFNDVCKCDINEVACCNTPIPPLHPVIQADTTQIEF